MVLATMIGLGNVQSITLAVILGFVFGFFLGLRPLLKANLPFSHAFKQVLVAEGLSIAVMETAEVLAEVYTPGVMSAGLERRYILDRYGLGADGWLCCSLSS